MLFGRAQGEELIYGFSTVWREGNVFGNTNGRNYFPMAPLKGEAGTQKWYGSQNNLNLVTQWAVTANCGAPEIVARLVDYMYSPMITLQNDGGPLGVVLQEVEDPNYPEGAYKVVAPEGFATHAEWYVDNHFQQVPRLMYGWLKTCNDGRGLEYFDPSEPHWTTLTDSFVVDGVFTTNGDNQKFTHSKIIGPSVVQEFPNVKPLQEETEELNLIEPDLMKYVEESLTRFIVGEMDVETEWDTYVETVKSMGYDRMLEIYQQQYDRYIGK